MDRVTIVVVAVVAAIAAPQLKAQTATAGSRPPPEYQSAFGDYRPFKDQPVASWRDVNGEVARVGGHAGVLKSDAATAKSAPGLKRPADPATAAPAATPAPAHPSHR